MKIVCRTWTRIRETGASLTVDSVTRCSYCAARLAVVRAVSPGSVGGSAEASPARTPAPLHRGKSVAVVPGSGMLCGMPDVTRLLDAAAAGDQHAAAELLPLVYTELRALAAARMAAERPGQT